jgi:GNAT superfamily N-acetyltransferase
MFTLKDAYESKKGIWIAYVATDVDTKQIIGWAMSTESIKLTQPTCFYFYVQHRYRRKGIGSRLLKRCFERLGKLYSFKMSEVCPHDKRSKGFFQKNKITDEHGGLINKRKRLSAKNLYEITK